MPLIDDNKINDWLGKTETAIGNVEGSAGNLEKIDSILSRVQNIFQMLIKRKEEMQGQQQVSLKPDNSSSSLKASNPEPKKIEVATIEKLLLENLDKVKVMPEEIRKKTIEASVEELKTNSSSRGVVVQLIKQMIEKIIK